MDLKTFLFVAFRNILALDAFNFILLFGITFWQIDPFPWWIMLFWSTPNLEWLLEGLMSFLSLKLLDLLYPVLDLGSPRNGLYPREKNFDDIVYCVRPACVKTIGCGVTHRRPRMLHNGDAIGIDYSLRGCPVLLMSSLLHQTSLLQFLPLDRKLCAL